MKRYLFSREKFTVKRQEKSRALNLLIESGLRYEKSNINCDNELEIIAGKDRKDIHKILATNGIDFRCEKIAGALFWIENLTKRIGLISGAIIVLVALYLSSMVIWKFEVKGNEIYSDEEIIEELKAAGIYYGSLIPKIDYDALHNKILLNSKKLSWISVNITGNTATVLVKESSHQDKGTSPTYSNVIAKSDGQIASIVVIEGKKEVSVGDVVKKGEVLISGIMNSQSQGTRYEYADGNVSAYVNKKISIEIPFKSTVKSYTGEKYINKIYKLYNFPIKFFSKYSNSGSFYDTIEKKEMLSIFGISEIPLEIITITQYEYVYKDIEYSSEEAVDLAFKKLRKELDYHLQNAEIISKNVTTYYDDDAFYIECDLYCLENIATQQEFYLED